MLPSFPALIRLSALASRARPSILAACVALATTGAAAAESSLPVIKPPAKNWAKVCADGPSRIRPGTDWSRHRGPIRGPSQELLRAASYYEAQSDLETAKRLIQTVLERKDAEQPAAAYRMAMLVLEHDLAHGGDLDPVALLTSAFQARSGDAARGLGRVYHRGLGGVAPNPVEALRYYRIAAAAGVGSAYVDIAQLHADGTLPAVDPAERDAVLREAVAYIARAAEQGSCEVLLQAARLYEKGTILPQDGEAAVLWYKAAREGGSIPAALSLGRILSTGELVPADPAAAFENYAIVAEKGDPTAMYAVARLLLQGGEGVPSDTVTAERYLKVLADEGLVAARKLLIRLYGGEYGGDRRVPELVAAIEAYRSDGIVTAPHLRIAGQAYLTGEGVEADPERGVSYLMISAARGDGLSARLVAEAYETGVGVPASQAEASRYYQLAVGLGNSGAMTRLAERHACGLGETRDPGLARSWSARAVSIGGGGILAYVLEDGQSPQGTGPTIPADERLRVLRAAAEAGHPRAIAVLERSYRSGAGVDADDAEADRWLEVATAKDADGEALLNLGRLTLNGQFGPRDVAAAEGFYKAAVERGLPRALYEYAVILAARGDARPADVKALFHQAAEAGHGPAARELYRLMTDTETVGGKNRDEWLDTAAAVGDLTARLILAGAEEDPVKAEAMIDAVDRSGAACNADEVLSLADAYFRIGTSTSADKAKALVKVAEAYNPTDPEEIGKLGRLLAEGVGGPDRVGDAEAVLERAWTKGNTVAGLRLAQGLLDGLFKADMPRAVGLLIAVAEAQESRAAERLADLIQKRAIDLTPEQIDRLRVIFDREAPGSIRISRIYGMVTASGLFGEDRRAEGVALIENAAKAGDLAAMRWLARSAMTGRLMDRSPAVATAWLEKAAALGDPEAMYELSAAYEAGFGVDKDAGKSADWRSRAIAAGYRP